MFPKLTFKQRLGGFVGMSAFGYLLCIMASLTTVTPISHSLLSTRTTLGAMSLKAKVERTCDG